MERNRDLPQCKFGSKCYRKNPDHWLHFWHPNQSLTGNEAEDDKPVVTSSAYTLPELCSKLKEDCSRNSSSHASHGTSIVVRDKLTREEKGPSTVLNPGSSTDGANPSLHGARNSKEALVLMLVGPPGSGKSTFCHKILRNAARPWTRVCQDVIANGKRGTKAQCLKVAGTAVSAGSSILIDRCNLDVEQRKEFLHLAKERGIEAHAVVLNLPVSVCIQRAMQRTGHEGGLEGANVGGVVNRMSRTRKPPTLEEGFARVIYCRTDAEVEDASLVYSKLDPWGHLSLGVFGGSVKECKGSLQPFLQRASRNEKLNASSEPGNRLNKKNPTEFMSSFQPNSARGSPRNDNYESAVPSVGKLAPDSQGASESRGSKLLAFPSISTADFHFDHERASSIIVETAAEFHRKKDHAGLRLVFVDLSASSDMLARVTKKAAEAGLDSEQLLIHAGDITRLCTSGGLQCNIIANAANWRLKPGGGGVNAAIYKAAGPELEQATKECSKTLSPGSAVAVPLPASSPLRREEGVTHVIHVLGPNMNPQRPNCLAGDYIQGCDILRATYRRLFETFAMITMKARAPVDTISKQLVETAGRMVAGDISRSKNGGDVGTIPATTTGTPANAFTMMMQAAKRKGTGDLDSRTKRERPTEEQDKSTDQEIKELSGSARSSDTQSTARDATCDAVPCGGHTVHEFGMSKTVQEVERGSKNCSEERPVRKWGAWAQALRDIALRPEHASSVIQLTKEAVVIPDMYPKAKKHLLVLVRRRGLDCIDDVRVADIPLLLQLHSLGETWAKIYLKEDPTLVFRLGYHWVPSMRQLHMHVISQDFDSSNLKNKKHWNSFTTGFFRDSAEILAEVEKHGQVKICTPEKEHKYLGMELRCHRCRSAQPNIPRLKSHLRTCKIPLSSDKGEVLIPVGGLCLYHRRLS